MDNPNDPHAGPASMSAVVERYQQHCQSGETPDLAGFVASVPKIDPRELAALVHVDQRHRHAAGAPLPAESYFESFPALRSDTELALDVVYQEYVLKRDAGEAYSTDKYLARFPDLAEQLAMQFDLDGAMGDEHSSRSANMQATVEQSPAYPPGTVIAGRYKLLEEIGEGGMGTVWVAQQTEPVRRRVALKLIKLGMDSRQVLSRFEAERQALAVMDHPHIAKVLDGGMTDQGRPYFVMEYVKGEPITDYCDHARLSVQERLKLFVQVCQAVQHAHQKGIIHRDLKPSNILVCPYDGQPVPKVIDFGLAKAMHQPLTEHSLYTAHGVMVGTPLYMSPEQAETNNLDIDTRSDLYSLGVILYELLTGSTPLEKRRLQDAALQEMLRLIQEEEPPKPSTRLSGSGSLPTIAAQRSLEPAQLSRAVRGDLDWIVMKSLEKERSRRYETANGLARDIERYLHDDPVEARPPSAGYRFSKFARRNKGVLLTIGFVAAALVVGTMVSTWQAIRATRAERVAQAKQAEADANYQKAKAAVEKYFTLVSESTLFDVPGLESLRKDLLEAAVEFYEGAALERTDDPAVLAELAAAYLRVGQVDIALNRLDDGFPRYLKALDLVERLRREHPGGGDHELKLAGFWKGLRWTRSGVDAPRDLEGAFQVSFRLEAIWKQLAAEHPAEAGFQADLVWIQCLAGSGFSSSGRATEGNAYFRKARAIAEKLVSDYPQVPQYRADLAMVNFELANNLFAAGELKEALALIRQAAQLSEDLVAEFPKVPAYRFGLARFLWTLASQLAKTQPEQAEESYRRALDLSEALVREFPDQHLYMETWVRCGADWASFEISRGNHSQAEDLVRKVIEPFETRVRDHPKDQTAREQLASALREIAGRLTRQAQAFAAGGKSTQAEQAFRQAREVAEELLLEFPGQQQPLFFATLAWAEFLAASNDPACKEVLRKSIETWEAQIKERPKDEAARIQLAALCLNAFRRSNDAAAAEPMVRRALALFTELAAEFPTDTVYPEYVGWTCKALGDIAQRSGRLAEAREHYEMAAATFAKLAADKNVAQHNGQYRAWEADSLSQLAQVLADDGKAPDAEQANRRAIELAESLILEFPGQQVCRGAWEHATFTWAWFNANKSNDAGDRETMKRFAETSEAQLKKHPQDRTARTRLAIACLTAGERSRHKENDAAEAERLQRRAVGLFRALADEFPAETIYLEHVGWSCRFLGEIGRDARRFDEAREEFKMAADAFAKLASDKAVPQRDGHYRNWAADSLSELAQVLAAAGHAQDAAAAARRSVELCHTLTKEYPGNLPYQQRLASALGFLAERLAAIGQTDEAEAARQRVAEMWEALLAEHPQDRQAREQLASAITEAADKAQAKSEMQEPLHRRALALHAQLAKEIPGDLAHFEQVGNFNRRLGWLLRDKGDLEEARQCFDKAADAFAMLAEDETIPQRDGWYRASQVDSLWDLARLLAASDARQAAAVAERSVDLCQTLTKEYPGNLPYQQRLASALGFLAERLAAIGQTDEAEAARQRVAEMWEAFLAENPQDRQAREQLASAVGEAAISLQSQSDRDLCEPFLRRALALRVELAKEIPGDPVHLEQVGHFTRRLGWLARDKGQQDEARQCFEDAAETFEKLAAGKIPQRDGFYRAFQIDSLWDLARLLATSDAEQAAAIAERSLDLCQTLTKEYPGNLQHRQWLASALSFLGERLAAIGQHDEANAARQRVAEMWESILAENPQDRQAREQLASALAEAADRSQANPAVREPLLRRALALHTELASEPSGNPGHLESTGHLHRHLAWLERSQGRLDEARQDFEKGAEAFAKLAADKIPQRDGYYRTFHADTLIHMAITQARGGHIDEAIATARQGVELFETLVSEFTGNLDYRQKMSWAVQVLAQRVVAAGQPQDAVQTCRRQISFCEKLQHDHPQVDFKPQLASAYLALCSSLTSASQIDEAQQSWEKAVEMGLSDANALNEFAWNLVAARDVEPALAALAVKAAQQATTAAPNDAMILNTLGVAQYRAGKWADAIQSLAKAEELAPDKTLAFNGFFLAMAHWQLGHKDEARKWYDKSVEWMEKNQPKNEELLRFRAEAEQLLGILQPAPTDAPQGDDAAKSPN